MSEISHAVQTPTHLYTAAQLKNCNKQHLEKIVEALQQENTQLQIDNTQLQLDHNKKDKTFEELFRITGLNFKQAREHFK